MLWQVKKTLGLRHAILSDIYHTLLTFKGFETGYMDYLQESGECIIAQYEKQLRCDTPDDRFCLDLVEPSVPVSYEGGKKFLLLFPHELREAPEKYKLDKPFIMELLQKDVHILEFVDDKLKDRELMDCACEVDPSAVRYFGETVQYKHIRKYKRW